MKKILAFLAGISLITTPALAHPGGFEPNPYRDHHGNDGTALAVGALLGIIVGSAIANADHPPHYEPIPPQYDSRGTYQEPPVARCYNGRLGWRPQGRYICAQDGGIRYWL